MPRSSEKPAAQPAPQPARRSAARATGGPSATLITAILALLLLGVGAAGYAAANLLQSAIMAPVNATPASTAAFVCSALQRQDYQTLAPYIDPAPAPPAITGAFDATATIAALRARDANEGDVVACATAPFGSGSVVSTDGATRYQLTLRRAKAAGPATGALVLRQQSSGARGWLIERDSSFLLPAAG